MYMYMCMKNCVLVTRLEMYMYVHVLLWIFLSKVEVKENSTLPLLLLLTPPI